MSEHTKTPWRACDSHPQRACIYIKPVEGWQEVAILYGGFDDRDVKDENGVWQNDTMRMANAAFIVKAVNAHDDLVKALEEIVKYSTGRFVYDVAAAALASVKEKSQ